MDYRWRRRIPEARYTRTKPLESIEADRAHGQWKDISRGVTYHFGKPLERSATRPHGLIYTDTKPFVYQYIGTLSFHFIFYL